MADLTNTNLLLNSSIHTISIASDLRTFLLCERSVVQIVGRLNLMMQRTRHHFSIYARMFLLPLRYFAEMRKLIRYLLWYNTVILMEVLILDSFEFLWYFYTNFCFDICKATYFIVSNGVAILRNGLIILPYRYLSIKLKFRMPDISHLLNIKVLERSLKQK